MTTDILHSHHNLLSDFQPNWSALTPEQIPMGGGRTLSVFRHPGLNMVKLDITFEAGSCYQPKLLVAAAAGSLIMEGTAHHTAQQIAEFMDARGIVVERNTDSFCFTLTLYTLPKYLPELLPLLHEVLTEATYPEQPLYLHLAKKKQQLQAHAQRTDSVARNLFYRALYGAEHPLGHYAMPEDADSVTPEDVRDFYAARYPLAGASLQISGDVDDSAIAMLLKEFDVPVGKGTPSVFSPSDLQPPTLAPARRRQPIAGAVQSTLRIGRLLPMAWDNPDYAAFTVLNTVLGGYFGSRLMSNIREEKGYTYGIYSNTHLLRGSILFSIAADVRGDSTEAAVQEVYRELQCLQEEPIPEEELRVVKNYLVGDFLRSIDGIFERSERYRQQQVAVMTDLFDRNFFQALHTVTPNHLQQLAQQLFSRGDLSEVVVGVVGEV